MGLALAGLAAVAPARAAEFKSYQRSNPAAFDEGVRAYDAGDYAKAYAIWLPLAQHQDPAAMRNVAQLLRRGLGVPQDLKRALIFYKRAAGFGLAGAQANLAMMYYEGEGTPRDPKEAARWFLAAARQGHVLAQFELAQMLEKGDGVPTNPRAARVFYAAAAKGGYQPAVDRLSALDLSLGVASSVPMPESVAVASGGVPTPRPRPENAAEVAAAFLLRGSLKDDNEVMQMAPDALFALRSTFGEDKEEATLLGLPQPAVAQTASVAASDETPCASPSNPFDRRPMMCRMPPIDD